MTSNVDMVFIKVVVVIAIYNFAIDKFFTWKNIVPNIHFKILRFLYLNFWNFQTILDGDTPYFKIVQIGKI